MSNIAIEFQNVGKQYHLGTVGTGTLSHDLNRFWQTQILRREDPYLRIGETNDRTKKGCSDFVWALRDISFKVEQGEVLGIIGKNGAGKSTLLKLLSNITSPTTGSIKYRGRIASLLEVGTGFHPEMTGRENIYMNGSIMGMTKAEITRKLDEIVDFAGVERYLDTPVKRYSSGMTVRLGFAVAAFLEPEILVVDEVLTVGDAEFQKKAIGKMHDVACGGGRTVLFVSHNMASVKNLCTRGIVLQNGTLNYDGNIEDAISIYTLDNTSIKESEIVDFVDLLEDSVSIKEISLNGNSKNYVTIKPNEKVIELSIIGESHTQIKAEVKFFIRDFSGNIVASLMEGRYRASCIDIEKGAFQILKKVIVPRFVSEGDYYLDIYLHQPLVKNYFEAKHCVNIRFDGNFEGEGRPLRKQDGFLGLECIETIYSKL